ncbi:MAG: signal recognition particle protein, partial [Methylocella sp.]
GGAMGKMASMFGLPGGGMGDAMRQSAPKQLAATQRQVAQRHITPAPGQSRPAGPAPNPASGPPDAPKLPGLGGAKLPGLGGGLWRGLNPFGKKK